MTFDDRESAALAWSRLAKPAQRSLELAHAALASGGLAVGAVLADRSGVTVAEGRNRAHDPLGGNERLRGTPLAHAELNVLAAVDTDRDLSTDTLWSTVQPCSMCDAALVFIGVGAVRWLAPDPWARAAGVSEERAVSGLHRVGPDDDRWFMMATVLFVTSIALRRGFDHPTVIGNSRVEPESASLLHKLTGTKKWDYMSAPLPDLLASLWDLLLHATLARQARLRSSAR